jgi:hypothetical protein
MRAQQERELHFTSEQAQFQGVSFKDTNQFEDE